MPGLTLILFAGSLSFGGPEREAPADRWFAKDKLYHFTASAVLQSAGHTVLRANGRSYRDASRTAAGLTLGVGVAKELWDRRQGRPFSWKDLGADAAGTAAGAAVVARFDARGDR